MKSLMRNMLGVFIVLILSGSALASAWADDGKGSQRSSSPTAYESHAGLFVKRSSPANEDPLIWDEGKVSRPIFKVVDRADDIVGRTFHTKTYRSGTQESFITTEDADGAKMGFDF